jgi:hypothetical protein
MYSTIIQTILNSGSQQKTHELLSVSILNNLFQYKYVNPHRLVGTMFQRYRNRATEV